MKRSQRFRTRVLELYETNELTPADWELLEEIELNMDMLDEIRTALKNEPLIQVRQGGPRVSPLVVEERLRSQQLAQLLARWPELSDAA